MIAIDWVEWFPGQMMVKSEFVASDNPVNFLPAERTTQLASVWAGYTALSQAFIFQLRRLYAFPNVIAGSNLVSNRLKNVPRLGDLPSILNF